MIEIKDKESLKFATLSCSTKEICNDINLSFFYSKSKHWSYKKKTVIKSLLI